MAANSASDFNFFSWFDFATDYTYKHVDVVAITATIDVLGAIGIVWIMQSVTYQFNLKSQIGLIKTIQRLVLSGLAIAMLWNAGYTVSHNSGPRFVDFIVQVMFFIAIIWSAVRHTMTAPSSQKQISSDGTAVHG